jgi:hypothetical protein
MLDANLLREHERLPNADHLAGIAAECAIKSVLVTRPDGEVEGGLRTHLPVLWERVRLQSMQGPWPNLHKLLQAPSPFVDWKVDQRYDDGSLIGADTVGKHLKAARRVCGAVGITGTRRGA